MGTQFCGGGKVKVIATDQKCKWLWEEKMNIQFWRRNLLKSGHWEEEGGDGRC